MTDLACMCEEVKPRPIDLASKYGRTVESMGETSDLRVKWSRRQETRSRSSAPVLG